MKKNKLIPMMCFVFALAVLLAPSALATYEVLWDTSHGVFGGDYHPDPGGYYSKLSDHLTANNFNVSTTTSAFDSANLVGIDVAVVAVTSSYYSVYGTSEIAALKTFVDSGGGLLIMGDRISTPIGNINPLASEFGISFGPTDIGSFGVNVTDFSAHEIFDGINQVSLYAASEITLSGSAVSVGRDVESGKTAIAVSDYGLGKVVAIGDSSLWVWDGNHNTFFDLPDNQQFALNTFEYLAVPEPATLVILGIGGFFVVGKKRYR